MKLREEQLIQTGHVQRKPGLWSKPPSILFATSAAAFVLRAYESRLLHAHVSPIAPEDDLVEHPDVYCFAILVIVSARGDCHRVRQSFVDEPLTLPFA